MSSLSYISLQGGANKKTLHAIIISASVVFVVAIVLLLVWALRRPPVDGPAPAARPKQSAPRSRVAIEAKTGSDADVALGGSEPAVVFVYAEWCGFCKRADPIFSALAADPAYSHVKMVKLNSAKAAKFVAERGISGFPVFLTNFGKNKKIVGYKPKEGMEAFLKEAPRGGGVRHAGAVKGAAVKGAAVKGAVSESKAMAALEGNAPVVVFVGADWCGFCKKLMPIWEEVVASGKFKGVQMMRIDAKDAPALVKKHSITGFPVLLSNKAERKYIGYRPKEKLEEILVKVQAS